MGRGWGGVVCLIGLGLCGSVCLSEVCLKSFCLRNGHLHNINVINVDQNAENTFLNVIGNAEDIYSEYI